MMQIDYIIAWNDKSFPQSLTIMYDYNEKGKF